MSRMVFTTSERDRKCRLCDEVIPKHVWALTMENLKVSPRCVDLHFHEGCFMRALEWAKEHRNDDTEGKAVQSY